VGVLLRINGEAADYTLEKESRLSEVVRGVEDWLGGSGYLITGILQGGRDLLQSPTDQWGSTPLREVTELDFQVSHVQDVRVEHWVTVRSLVAMVQKELSAPSAALADLADTLPGALHGLRTNQPSPAAAASAERLRALFDGQGAEQIRAWPGERREAAGRLMDELREELSRRIGDASHPKEALRECIQGLEKARLGVADVSVLLQAGRDRQAMEAVIGFSDLVQRLLSVLPFFPPEREREKLFGEINAVLKELLAAFGARDLVLIGDLFEYEVGPRIQKLVPLLESCL
jgi:hypothetical protein